ncbi:MAG: tetratricopeptide repeat protein [Gammaproteobacteria bacterium]|nr:tetratricopeptide repeat protein [Gammaproteobacteria bacterium]MDH3767370.1 tetratricopeptide repeat protein [Gammaproteobacteria bacterium]
MIRITILACVVGLCACQAAARPDTVTVDEIVARHIEAIGGEEAIRNLQNLVFGGGLYEEEGYSSDGNATMSLGRPFFKLVGDKTSGYAEGYDGAAWEWFENPGIVVRTVGKASEAIRHYAGVESPLLDYREKGSSARLIGETELDARAVFVIQLERRDGFIEQFYIDKNNYLINASGREAPIHAFGDSVTRLNRISDYRTVGGVQIAHHFESVEMPSGKPLSSMQWGSIKANQELPADWFSPPEFERTPLQTFIEQLYGQRSDIAAVMWTYHEFRRANPEIDISDPVNMAAFQILKMGDVDNAIALLEQNAKDYPDSANTRFGLGRAYQTAKRLEDAKTEFLAALNADPDHARSKAALEALLKKN